MVYSSLLHGVVAMLSIVRDCFALLRAVCHVGDNAQVVGVFVGSGWQFGWCDVGVVAMCCAPLKMGLIGYIGYLISINNRK
jgi:hypothetical protein